MRQGRRTEHFNAWCSQNVGSDAQILVACLELRNYVSQYLRSNFMK